MAAANNNTQVPEFKWAQNADNIYLQVGVTGIDSKTMKTDITKDTFSFYGEANKQAYELKFKFLHPVKSTDVKYKVGRLVEFVIEKESSAFWDGLLAAEDKKRLKNRCTIDWSRWVEEDAEDGEDKFGNMNDFSSMGGGGMGGMPGMGGMGGMPGMGGMGGMPGMGGMGGMPGMGGMGGGGGMGGMDMNALNEMMKNMKGGGMGGMGGGHDDHDGHDHGDHDHDHDHEHESGDSDDSDDAPVPDIEENEANKKSHHGHAHPHPHPHSEDHKHDEHAEKPDQQMESNPDHLSKNVNESANDAKDEVQDVD